MTEATTAAATKVKPAKAASAFQLPKYGMPNFDLPKMEVPEAFRAMAENSVAQARHSCEKAKSAAADASDLVQNSYITAAKGAMDYNLKLIEIARTNMKAGFGYIDALLGVKSPSEFAELSSVHTREQLNAVTEQTKELMALAEKVATETGEPLKTGLTKALGKFASSQGGYH
jgi:phasin